MLHRKGDFGENFAGILADDRRAQDPVTALCRQDFDKTMRLALRNRAVEIIEVITRQIKGYALLFRFSLGEAHRCEFGLCIGYAWQDAVIGPVFFIWSGKRIDAGIPCFMTAAMGELLTPRNIASAQDMRRAGAQKHVVFQPSVNDQPKFF